MRARLGELAEWWFESTYRQQMSVYPSKVDEKSIGK